MRKETWRYFDFLLFGVVILLSVFGVVMIRSATAGTEVESITRQMIFVAVGFVVVIIVTLVDYHYWATIAKPMYILTVGLLIFIFLTGQSRFGASRWVDLGLILIQPSELAKIVIILVLADFFSKHQNQPHNLYWIGQSLLVAGGVIIWVFLQPNLSTSIVLLVLWFSMLFITGLPIKYILIFGGVAIAAGIIAFPFLEVYQQQRVLNFLFPDPNATYGNTYNVDQALITIGSGGWLGMGYGHGSQVQLRFLKVRHTDFIFASMAEEFGFVGTVIVLALLFFVVFRCFRVARNASDMYGSLIAYGFGVLILFQTVVNVGVNLRVIPVTGLTLPFISYGGSSILSLLLGIGLVESVAIRQKKLEF